MKRTFKVICAISMIMAAITGLLGCQVADNTPGKQTQSNEINNQNNTNDNKYKIGVSTVSLEEAYWKGNKAGLEKAAAEFNAQLVFEDAKGDINNQLAQIDRLIQQKVDAIICTPVDTAAILLAVKKCNNAKIPFIFNDRVTLGTESINVDYGVSFDMYDLSQAGAEWMADYAHKNNIKLKILEILGTLTDQNTQSCTDALADVVAKYPERMQVVTQIPGELLPSKVLTGTVNALQSQSGINCIFYHSDFYHSSVVSALQQTYRWKKTDEAGHIVIVAAGGEKETLNALKDGYIDLLEVMPTVKVGYEAVKAAVEILESKNTEKSKFINGFTMGPSDIDTKAEEIFGNY
jgi:ABC-type sugar transport system substrate-binding protein